MSEDQDIGNIENIEPVPGPAPTAPAPIPLEPIGSNGVNEPIGEPIPAHVEAPVETPIEPIEESAPTEPKAEVTKVGDTVTIFQDMRPEKQEKGIVGTLLEKAKSAIQFRKAKKLERIIIFARHNGEVVNADVEKLLRVSDATATRYLSALVTEGRLTRTGQTPRIVYKPVG